MKSKLRFFVKKTVNSFKLNLIQKFERNTKGKDYIVGDIHGMYHLLIYALESKLNFNFENDRLFAVGDLIDRGENSVECLDLLNQSWFHSIMGNHEEMLFKSYLYENLILNNSQNIYNFNSCQVCDNHNASQLALNSKPNQNSTTINSFYLELTDDAKINYQKTYEHWIGSDGLWFDSLLSEEQDRLFNLVCKMPIWIEIESNHGKKIGINHADYFLNDWGKIYQIQSNYLNENEKNVFPDYLSKFVWDRSLFNNHNFNKLGNDENLIQNVEEVVVGHNILGFKKDEIGNPIKSPVYFGNMLYLDTGAFMPHYLKSQLKRINNEIHTLKKYRENNFNFEKNSNTFKNGQCEIEKIKNEKSINELIESKIRMKLELESTIESNLYSLSFYSITDKKIIQVNLS